MGSELKARLEGLKAKAEAREDDLLVGIVQLIEDILENGDAVEEEQGQDESPAIDPQAPPTLRSAAPMPVPGVPSGSYLPPVEGEED